jgi:hypothetical protein
MSEPISEHPACLTQYAVVLVVLRDETNLVAVPH